MGKGKRDHERAYSHFHPSMWTVPKEVNSQLDLKKKNRERERERMLY